MIVAKFSALSKSFHKKMNNALIRVCKKSLELFPTDRYCIVSYLEFKLDDQIGKLKD